MKIEDLIILNILLDDEYKPKKRGILSVIFGLILNYLLILLIIVFILAFFDKYINGIIFYSLTSIHFIYSIIVIVCHFKSKQRR